jgi:hypothetical protein
MWHSVQIVARDTQHNNDSKEWPPRRMATAWGMDINALQRFPTENDNNVNEYETRLTH